MSTERPARPVPGPWLVVAAVGFALALGGAFLPWRYAEGQAVFTEVPRLWWPWWPIWLVVAAVSVAAAARREYPRDVPAPALALVGLVPAAALAGLSGSQTRGAGAALAFGGAALAAVAVTFAREGAPPRLTVGGRMAVAALAALVVASALPWSVPDADTGAFAVLTTEGWGWVVWLVGALAATALTTVVFLDRTGTTSAAGTAAATGVVVTVLRTAAQEPFDVAAPGVLLAGGAGIALLAAVLVARREDLGPARTRHAATRHVAPRRGPIRGDGGAEPEPRSTWGRVAGPAAAVLAWAALLAGSAPWLTGPTYPVRDDHEVAFAPVAWGGDLVGTLPLLAVSIALVVVVAVVAVVGREALGAGAAVVGAAVAAAAAGPVLAGGPLTWAPYGALVLGVLAVVAGTAAALASSSRVWRIAPVVALAGLALFAPVDLAPATDGPFEVLQGGEAPVRVGAVASGTRLGGREALPDELARFPVVLDGAPGLVLDEGPARRPVSYHIVDGRILPMPTSAAAVRGQLGQRLLQAGTLDPSITVVTELSTGEGRSVHGLEVVPAPHADRMLVRVRSGIDDAWYEIDRATFDTVVETGDPRVVESAAMPASPVVPSGDDELVLLGADVTYVARPGRVDRVEADGRRLPFVGTGCVAADTAVEFGHGRARAGRVVLDADDHLWFPVADATGERWAERLHRVAPDGTVEMIDHPLGAVESLVVSADGDLLVVEGVEGRLLRVPEPASHLVPADAGASPDGCRDDLAPEVVAAPVLGRLAVDTQARSRWVGVDADGSAVGLDATDPSRIVRIAPDGAVETVAEVATGRVVAGSIGVRPDGSLWWFERLVGDQGFASSRWVLRGTDATGDPHDDVTVDLGEVGDVPLGARVDAGDGGAVIVTRTEVLGVGADGVRRLAATPEDARIGGVVRHDDGRIHVLADGQVLEVVGGELRLVGFGVEDGASPDLAALAASGDGVDELVTEAGAILGAGDGGLVVATATGLVHLDPDGRPDVLGGTDVTDPSFDALRDVATGLSRGVGWSVVDGAVLVPGPGGLGFEVVAELP
ncbi:hypothetical protein FTX61_13995 [Nitriliruptoraceae bacterium ZYF776]|nr:hypothetical protein [Profundirhabdus halotolerans]